MISDWVEKGSPRRSSAQFRKGSGRRRRLQCPCRGLRRLNNSLRKRPPSDLSRLSICCSSVGSLEQALVISRGTYFPIISNLPKVGELLFKSHF